MAAFHGKKAPLTCVPYTNILYLSDFRPVLRDKNEKYLFSIYIKFIKCIAIKLIANKEAKSNLVYILKCVP